MKKLYLILFSGLFWLFGGLSLLMRGLKLLTSESQLLEGGKERVLLLISIGLLIGFVKGHFVLKKSARRILEKILSLKEPIPFSQVYGRKFYFLIGGMILLGVSLRFIGLPHALHGTIDVAIGSALIHGAFVYFRAALRKEIA